MYHNTLVKMASKNKKGMDESSTKKGSCRLNEDGNSPPPLPSLATKRSVSPSAPKNSSEDSSEENKKQKLSFGLCAKSTNLLPAKNQTLSSKKGSIQIKFGGQKPISNPAPVVKSVAAIFNDDDDDDETPEEMPPEARMRMRNIGRDTPTSAGPNSFGKTKQGFCDSKKVFEKSLKNAMEKAYIVYCNLFLVGYSFILRISVILIHLYEKIDEPRRVKSSQILIFVSHNESLLYPVISINDRKIPHSKKGKIYGFL